MILTLYFYLPEKLFFFTHSVSRTSSPSGTSSRTSCSCRSPPTMDLPRCSPIYTTPYPRYQQPMLLYPRLLLHRTELVLLVPQQRYQHVVAGRPVVLQFGVLLRSQVKVYEPFLFGAGATQLEGIFGADDLFGLVVEARDQGQFENSALFFMLGVFSKFFHLKIANDYTTEEHYL